jgi:hypothetical protein
MSRVSLQRAGIVTAFTLFYLATLTSDYYWDGITFALQIEKVASMERSPSVLFHQNLLFYNSVGYLPYYLTRAAGFPLRALYLLQIGNALAAAVAVAVFFRLAEIVTRSRYAAIVSAAGLAFSAVWWKLATDANAYVVSILLILICAGTVLSSRPRWLLVGLTLAGAVLVHQLAALFYPAALVAVFSNPSIEKKRPFAAKFTALAWGITGTAYALCAILLHSLNEPLAIMKWAVSNQSGVALSASPLPGLKSLPRGTLDLIVGHSIALYRSQGGWIPRLLALTTLILTGYLLIKVLRKGRLAQFLTGALRVSQWKNSAWKIAAPMLIVWIGAYLVFLLFWEPWQVIYRAFYVPPLALMFGIVLSNYHSASQVLPTGASMLAVVTLALSNLTFFIAPNMQVTANPTVAAARTAHHLWNGQTVIYFADRNEADTAFEYFNDQTEWRRFRATTQIDMDDEIQRLSSQGGQVWLNKDAADLMDFEWLARHASGRTITVESPNAPARYVELLPDQ